MWTERACFQFDRRQVFNTQKYDSIIWVSERIIIAKRLIRFSNKSVPVEVFIPQRGQLWVVFVRWFKIKSEAEQEV